MYISLEITRNRIRSTNSYGFPFLCFFHSLIADLTNLKMASGDVSKGRTRDVSSLMKIAGKAVEDIHSQAGRVASDTNLARKFGQTLLNNGVIDDRKYLVSAAYRHEGRICL